MLVRGHNKHGNGAGKKSDNFAELIKDKQRLKFHKKQFGSCIQHVND
jgi:hypothetical protein